jgi:hypothetical protein
MKKRLAIIAAAVVVVVVVLAAWDQSRTIYISNDLVDNGVALVVVCGEKVGTSPTNKSFMRATNVAPRGRVGIWSPTRKGDCMVWRHYPEGIS